jgi:hypothetical protein
MQIHGISSISAISSVSTSSAKSAVPARPAVVTVPSAAPGPAAATATTTPQPAVRSGGSGGGGGVTASALDAATTYSTTVGGKNYSGSVQESDGVYEASIPNLPGASASGSSAELAETNLDSLISVLA